ARVPAAVRLLAAGSGRGARGPRGGAAALLEPAPLGVVGAGPGLGRGAGGGVGARGLARPAGGPAGVRVLAAGSRRGRGGAAGPAAGVAEPAPLAGVGAGP